MKIQLHYIMLLLLFCFVAGKTATITIDANAPAKPIRMHNFYGGYHHNAFYEERGPAFKRMHDIILETSHKRPSIKYWRCQNLFTYRNDPDGPDGLRYATEKVAGHCYDTERYADTGGYNWDRVDEVLDEIVNRTKLVPIIEFNYMPECMALDPNEIGSYGQAIISPPKDYNEWRSLVKNTVLHLQHRYGAQAVKSWRWGVWNEPNFSEFWNKEKYGYEGFYKLYDYASAPLKEVDSDLQIGGPDYTGVHSNTKDFVQHTFSGTNFCTGETGSPCDYFSVHAYSSWVRHTATRVWTMASWMKEIYGAPECYNKKFVVTETAPNWHMSDDPFLQNRYTAAWLVALVDIFLEAADVYGEYYLPQSIHYCGSIRKFGKRSLFVSIYNDRNSDQVLKTAPFNIYEVLSMLSEERIPVQGCDFSTRMIDVNDLDDPTFDQIRCMATRTPGESIEILVYHFDQNDHLVYNERDDGSNPAQPYGTYKRENPITHRIDLTVSNIPFSNARIKKYVIDKNHSNSLAYHTLHGETKDFTELDAHDDLAQTENRALSISNNTYSESLTIQENSITLIVIEQDQPGPRLGLSSSQLDFGAQSHTQEFSILNSGDADLTWSLTENPAKNWIQSIQPMNGTLVPGASETVSVAVDRSGLSDGFYEGVLLASSNAGEKTINVLMQVGNTMTPVVFRLNAGGDSFQDILNQAWSADLAYSAGGFGYEGGQAYYTGDAISGTQNVKLYQTQRYQMDAYRFDVPNGIYKVILHFAEIYFEAANEISMNVVIEGETKISNLDIYQEAGHDAALVYPFANIRVTDGVLDIAFSAGYRDAKVSGIEVLQIGSADNTPPEAPRYIRIKLP